MKTSFARLRKELLLPAMIVCLVFASATTARAAGHLIEKTGWLTAIDENGGVVIGGRGYGLDAAALTEDARGRVVPVAQLALPAFVHFQFVYTARGPLIVRLKVDPRVRQ